MNELCLDEKTVTNEIAKIIVYSENNSNKDDKTDFDPDQVNILCSNFKETPNKNTNVQNNNKLSKDLHKKITF